MFVSLRLAWSTSFQDSQAYVVRPLSQDKTNEQTPAKYCFLFFHIALFNFASSFPPGTSQVNVYIFLTEDAGTQFQSEDRTAPQNLPCLSVLCS